MAAGREHGYHGPMLMLEWILVLLLAAVVLTNLAERLAVPYPSLALSLNDKRDTRRPDFSPARFGVVASAMAAMSDRVCCACHFSERPTQVPPSGQPWVFDAIDRLPAEPGGLGYVRGPACPARVPCTANWGIFDRPHPCDVLVPLKFEIPSRQLKPG